MPKDNSALASEILARFADKDLRGLDNLEGDFSLVLWDRLRNRTIAMRDPMGGYPLFWARHGHKFILSTDLGRIQAHLSSCQLNPAYLAEYFSSPSPFNEIPSQQCAVKQVQRVLPGSMIVYHHATRRVETRKYWDWLDRTQALRHGDSADTGANYLATLKTAIAQRIGKTTAAHCSGGMDSSAVALLAGELIRQSSTPQTLNTISLVYHDLRELRIDTPYLEAALEAGKDNFTSHLVEADRVLDFDSFLDPPWHEEPYPGLWRLGMDRATIAAAADQGADTLLTGLGADEVFDQQPFHLADMIRQLRLRTAWREATRWAFADNCNPWEFIMACGWHPAVAAGSGWPAAVNRCLGSDEPMRLPEWLQKDFLNDYDLHARWRHRIKTIYNRAPTTTLSVVLDAIQARCGDYNRWHVGLPIGVHIHHPFLDTRVIVLGLSMIAAQAPQPGRMKPPLADALRDVLPQPILDRRRKGHFNEVYYQGLARHEPLLQDLIAHADIEPFINRKKLSAALSLAALGGLGVSQCRHLNLALCFARWVALKDEHATPSNVDQSLQLLLRVDARDQVEEPLPKERT
jgi:asparagine synthase (glutamine-hydrolysing)